MTAPYQPPPPDPGMTAAQVAAILALVEAQAKIRQQLTATAVAAAVAAFRGFTDWWNSDAVDGRITQALKVIQSTQRQAARVTDAYLTNAARTMTGRAQSPAGVVDVTKLRRAIPAEVAEELVAGIRKPAFVVLGDTFSGPGQHIDQPVKLAVRDDTDHVSYAAPTDPYGRIADQFRYNVVAKGDSEELAADKALVRVAVAAQNDVTAAVREQYHKTLGQLKPDGYRRILHPELTETGPCGLCVVAADRTYRISDLLPLHGRCVCEVLPIYGKQDPGISLNWEDLNSLYEAAGGTGAAGLKKIRVALAENGEIGPVLVDADRNHRDPIAVAKTIVPDRNVRARAQLDALEKSYATLQYRAEHGEKVDRPLRWQANKIAELRSELGLAAT